MTARRALWLVALLGAVLLPALSGCEDRSRVSDLEAELEACQAQCEERISAWRDALEEANSTIEELNGEIEMAQLYAGSTWGEMDDALSGLNTGTTTDEPE